MPPRRETLNAELAALVAQQVAAIIPTLVQHLQPNGATVHNAPLCTFKHFNSCNPPKFLGTEGATNLLQWFEGMENTFVNSDCPNELRVRHASSLLQKRALTWWNGEKRTRSAETALALSWDEFKRIMTAEFCPRSEIRKLETEFWELTQQSGEVAAYTTRFHELSILVPSMITPTERAIEKYIGGLPMPIHDTVLGNQPTTLEGAIRLATQLTDKHVKLGNLTRKGSKKPTETPTETTTTSKEMAESSPTKKRKANNFTTTTNPTKRNPATPTNQTIPTNQPFQGKPYNGPYPQCPTCSYHHYPNYPCRLCTNCGRFGHIANKCYTPQPALVNRPINPPIHPQALLPAPRQNRACYECGDPNHLRNQCPILANHNHQAARGHALNLNVAQARNNDEENGMFFP